MGFSISAQFKSGLARGVAVAVMCGAVVGCSRGMDGLTDGLSTNSVVRPQVPVGGGYGTIQEAAPQQNYQVPPPSSVAAAPVSPVYSSPVSSQPLPPPSSSAALPPPAAPAPQQMAAASNSVMTAPAPAAPAAPRTSSQGSGSYVVAPGDTLYGIARKTGASASAIQNANGLSTPDSIRIGQRLTIPGGSSVPTTTIAAAPAPAPAPVATPAVASAPQPKPIKVAAPVDAPKPVKASQPETVASYTPPTAPASQPKPASSTVSDVAQKSAEVAALPPEATGVGRLRWPVQGRVISQFGSGGGKSNDGIDIAVPEGTSVRAAENGVVIYAGDGLKGFGNTVLVRHEDGLVTVYGHASQLKVKRGDQVKRGQEVAISGMTGDADRPKLHFEVRKGTSPVNPMTYLN